MTLPLLVRFARPATGEAPVVPGRYDPQLGLRVVDTQTGAVPVVSHCFQVAAVTKTSQKLERDDEKACLASVTRTDVRRESDDTDVDESNEVGDGAEAGLERRVLALLTKTLHQREADDERPA
jgi:hypothetical protein